MRGTRTVAGYARVSSDQQAKSGTIESQIASLRERIADNGEQIADEMLFIDAGVSGATLVRPQLERLRDHAAFGLVDRLYVLSPDRLSRKYAHQVPLMEEFAGCGVDVIFLNHAVQFFEAFGETLEAEAVHQVLGRMVQHGRLL
jgi:site-specific DNA recombinase